MHYISVNHVCWRVTDELLWSLKKPCKKEELKECLLNANVFKVIFERYEHYFMCLGACISITVVHDSESNSFTKNDHDFYKRE